VIVFVEDGILKAKAFLLAQNLDQLKAFELDAFKVYQVALTEVEERCGLIFPDAIKGADSVGRRLKSVREVLSERRPLASIQDIDWS
jgi:endonuclease G